MVIGFFSILFLGLVLSSCGSLNRDLSLDGLSKDDMAYGDGLKSGVSILDISFGKRKFITDKTSNKLWFIPPVLSVESYGSSYNEYGLMKQLHIIPIFGKAKASVYDYKGNVNGSLWAVSVIPFWSRGEIEDYVKDTTVSTISILPIPLICLYNKFETKQGAETEICRVSILKIPILGPCFLKRSGPKSGTPRFLWIPCGKEE